MYDGKADVLTEKFSVRRGKFRALDSQLSIFCSDMCVYALTYKDQACHLDKRLSLDMKARKYTGSCLQWDDTFGVEEKARVEDKMYGWSVEAKTLMEKSCFCHKLM